MSRYCVLAPRSRHSAHLLRTTALLTLLPLIASIEPARADIVIDNAFTHGSTGATSAIDSTWSAGDEFWFDEGTGNYVSLGAGQTGKLINPQGSAATLDIQGTIDIGRLLIEENGFSLTGGTLQNSSDWLKLRTNNAGTRLTFGGSFAGSVAVQNGLDLLHSGNSNMAMLRVDKLSSMTNTGTISGGLRNFGTTTLEQSGSFTGSVQNSGTLNLNGDTANRGQINGNVDNISTVDTNAVLNIDDADINGNLNNGKGSTLNVFAAESANVSGDVQNDGSIVATGYNTKLIIGGRLTTSGAISKNYVLDDFIIDAEEILITDDRDIEGSVTLIGTEVIQGDRVFNGSERTLEGGLIDGGLLVEGDGRVFVRTDLDGSGEDIENQHNFLIDDQGSGRLTNIRQFRNLSSSATPDKIARLNVDEGTALGAETLINSGKVTNNGTITASSTEANAVDNLTGGEIVSDGTINANITNRTGATITSSGSLNGNVVNEAGGNLTSADLIDGDLVNAGTAALSGRVSGHLNNTAGASGSTDTLNVNGNLEVGSLENSGVMTIAPGFILNNTSGSATPNSGRLDVDGTLTGHVDNSGTLDVTGTVGGGIFNRVDAVLTSTGTIGWLNNYSARAENTVSGRVNGGVINDQGARLNLSATVDQNVTNNGNLTLTGVVNGKLTNKSDPAATGTTLTLGGNLEVGDFENNASFTIAQGQTLTNNSANLAINTARIDVDGVLASGVDNTGRLDVTGEISGDVVNRADGVVTSTGTIGRLDNFGTAAANSVSGNITRDLINRSGARLTSTAAVGGNLLNNGDLTVSGSVGGKLTNNSVNTDTETLFDLGGDLEVRDLENNGTITVDRNETLTTTEQALNTGTFDVDAGGTLAGAIRNENALTVAGTVSGVVTNAANAELVSTGTLGGVDNASASAVNSISGAVTGNVTNQSGANLVSTADIGGDFTNSGRTVVSGTIGGTLTNNSVNTDTDTLFDLGGDTAVGKLVNNGTITIDAGEVLTSSDTASNTGTMEVDGRLVGSVESTNNLTISGVVTGDVTNGAGGKMLSTGTIRGNVVSAGQANLTGTVRGTVNNSGAMNIAQNLTTGVDVADGATVTNTGVLNLSARLTGDIVNQKTMNIEDGRVVGSLNNLDLLQLAGSSSIKGNLRNTGTVTGLSSQTKLLLTDGIFYNNGLLNVKNDSILTITADLFELGTDSEYNNENVILIGDFANSGDINLVKDETLSGGIVNRTDGNVTISAAIDADGHDIDNSGDFLITSDNNSTGNLFGVTNLTNSGNFDIRAGTSVTAAVTTNEDGILTVGGNLNTQLENQQGATVAMNGGTVTGNLNNAGLVEGGGAIDGQLVNDGTVRVNDGERLSSTKMAINNNRMEVGGEFAANLRNTASGNVSMTGGTLDGDVDNRGSINGAGSIAGRLTNTGTVDMGGSMDAVVNSGTFGTNGNLSVVSLNNAGTVNIDAGDTLTSGQRVSNTNALNIAGTLNGALTSFVDATTTLQDGTIVGNVDNRGSLTGTGDIDGSLVNSGSAVFAGSAGQVDNSGTLRSAGDLELAGLNNTGTATVSDGTDVTVTSKVDNHNTLTIAGNLIGKVNNSEGATTELSDGTITGDVSNAGTFGGNGTVTGNLSNRGTVDIESDEKLSVGYADNFNTINIAGTLGGNLVNRAGATATLNSGTIEGDVTNNARFNGDGVIGGDLKNGGRIAVTSGERLSVAGSVTNWTSGVIALDGSTLGGSVLNAGTIEGSGTITGKLTSNGGSLVLEDRLTVGEFENIGDMVLASGDTLISQQQASNSGELTLAGRLQSDLANDGSVVLGGGSVSGTVLNNAGAMLSGNGTLGTLNNAGTARIAGSAGDVINDGTLETAGKLTVASLVNSGRTAVGSGEELVSGKAVQNLGTLSVAGTLTASLANAENASTTLNNGTISGNVLNRGTISGTGTFGQTVTNQSGTADIAGTISADLVNRGGTITTGGNLTVEGRILNSASEQLVLRQELATQYAAANPGLITISEGTVTTAKGGTQNGPNAVIQVEGTLISDVLNSGTVDNAGVITGDIVNGGEFNSVSRVNGNLLTGWMDGELVDSASASVGGRVTGNLIYAAGTVDVANGTVIDGTFDLRRSFELVRGQNINAAETRVRKGTTLSLAGSLNGNVSNAGRVQVSGSAAAISGNLTNNSLVDLRDGSARTVLTTGGMSGDGVIALDIITGEELLADRVVVDGGATTGNVHLTFDELTTIGGAIVGKRVTLLDVDEDYDAANTFTYSADQLSTASERIVYSVDQAGANGDVELVSQVNPAIGAMFANVTLVQSLIGSVINRPTSPYVTGLVTDFGEKPCGIGGWGRATGGTATVQGKTDNQVSVLDNEVSADYYGMQGGMDLVCFDDRYGGWDMAFGVLGGVNIGDSRQPIYAIDVNDSQVTTDQLASVTTTDFQQTYGGVYMTGTKGRWAADLQFRAEKTDFELENTAVTGSGLRLEDSDFSSDGMTLSGSLAYSMPVKDTGWVFTPNVGFSWSKYTTDDISFEGDFLLKFDDSERKIGFLGASVGKTFVRESENAAIHTFATATYYKDFADDAVSRLYNDTLEGYETQVLTSENLKSYSEVSVGANYVKVLSPGKSGRPRQFSTSARLDGRFGDAIDSVGITGQFRFQF